MRTEPGIDTDRERPAAADEGLKYGPLLSAYFMHAKGDLSGYAP